MKIKLLKVRLSFPHLFRPKSVGDSEPRYSANFLLSKKDDVTQIDALRAACMATAKEEWPTKIPDGVKYCVQDGSDKEYEGYGSGVLFISTSNAMRPPVVDENLSPITEEDRKIYAGCYVNVVIRLWAQNNKYGKRINGQLQAVQFVAQGEAFGDKPVDPAEEFAPVSKTADDVAAEFGPMGKPKTPPAKAQSAENEPAFLPPDYDESVGF